MKTENRRFKILWIVLFLFVVSFLPRILLLNDGLFHHDSVETAEGIKESIETSKLFTPVKSKYGYAIINIILVKIFDTLPVNIFFEHQLNIITVIFSCLAVVTMFLFVNELFDIRIAFWSALIFSFNGVFLSVSTYLKSHSMAMFFCLLSVYLFVKYLRSHHWGYLTFIPVYLFSLIVRTDNVVYFPLFLVMMVFSKRLGLGKSSNLILSIVFLVVNIISLFFLHIISPNEVTLKIIDLIFLYILSYRFVWEIAGIILIIAVVLLSWNLIFKLRMVYDKKNILLYIWMFVTLLPFQFVTVLSSRYLLHFIIPLVVFVCYNLKINSKILLKIVPILIIVLSVVSIYPVLAFRHDFCSTKELGLFINERHNNSCFILDDYGIFIRYYSNNSVIPYESFEDSPCSNLNNRYFVYFNFNRTRDRYLENKNLLEQDYNLTLDSTFYMEGYHHTEIRFKIIEVQILKLGVNNEPMA